MTLISNNLAPDLLCILSICFLGVTCVVFSIPFYVIRFDLLSGHSSAFFFFIFITACIYGDAKRERDGLGVYIRKRRKWFFSAVGTRCFQEGKELNDGGVLINTGLYKIQRGAFDSEMSVVKTGVPLLLCFDIHF